MSGHSKWSTIKHKKAALDAKRGKLFSKIVKEIAIAAKIGGGDPNTNVRLRSAVERAKSASMPSKNIENAIKKGTGTKEGLHYEEIVYEGYGPCGVAILVRCLTDNKKRTVSEVRSLFSKHGGHLGENGSVSWQFEKKGIVTVDATNWGEEQVMDLVLNAGAEDLIAIEGAYMIITAPDVFEKVSDAIRKKQIPILNAEVTMHPNNLISLSKEDGEKVFKLLELLDDLDDVQAVSSNENVDA